MDNGSLGLNDLKKELKNSSQGSSTVNGKTPSGITNPSDQGTFQKMAEKYTLGDLASNINPSGQVARLLPGADTKLYDVPVLGGVARGMTQPIIKAGETIAESIPATTEMITGINKGKPYQPHFISPDEHKQLSGTALEAGVEGLRTGAGAASFLLPQLKVLQGTGLLPFLANKSVTGGVRGTMYGSDLGPEFNPAITAASGIGGSILEPLMGLLGMGSTKSRVYKNAQSKVANSKLPTSMDDIRTEAKAELPDRLKSTYDLNKKEAEDILNTLLRGPKGIGNEYRNLGSNTPKLGEKGYDYFEAGPEGIAKARMMPPEESIIGSKRNLTPSELMEYRSWLSPEASQNYIERLFGFLGNKMNKKSDLEAKVADALRSVISAKLKDVAPEVGKYDQLYKLYNNPLVGPAWSWPIKGAAGAGFGGAASKWLDKAAK